MNRPTSLYLDIVRPMAALMVMLSHVSLITISNGRLEPLSGAGIQAVDVFFVLSGFVIAHICATREQSLRDYSIARAARIYSVAIPALIFTAMLDFIRLQLQPDSVQSPFQPWTAGSILRCLSFLNERWNAHRYPGTDGPYWSLGFEVWYYIAFGAFLFAPRRWRWIATAAVLAFIGPKVAILFPVWLMGVATYCICTTKPISPKIGWGLLILPLAALGAYQFLPHSPLQPFLQLSSTRERIESTAQDYFIGALFSIHLIGASAVSTYFAPLLERYARAIRWIAGATFSLYLVHLPLMHFLAAVSPWPKESPWTLALLLTVTPLVCLAFAEISERRKETWRRAIDHCFRLCRRLKRNYCREYGSSL